MNNLAGYNSVLGIRSLAFNLVVGAIILLAMLLFLGVYVDKILKRKEYKGFCERCGRRLETSRYIIKLCENCRMWQFTKNWAECNSIVSPSNFPSEFSYGKRHNIA